MMDIVTNAVSIMMSGGGSKDTTMFDVYSSWQKVFEFNLVGDFNIELRVAPENDIPNNGGSSPQFFDYGDRTSNFFYETFKSRKVACAITEKGVIKTANTIGSLFGNVEYFYQNGKIANTYYYSFDFNDTSLDSREERCYIYQYSDGRTMIGYNNQILLPYTQENTSYSEDGEITYHLIREDTQKLSISFDTNFSSLYSDLTDAEMLSFHNRLYTALFDKFIKPNL